MKTERRLFVQLSLLLNGYLQDWNFPNGKRLVLTVLGTGTDVVELRKKPAITIADSAVFYLLVC